MANFGDYFLQGYRSSFNPTFQNVLSGIQRKKLLKEQEEKEIIKQQQQQDILSKLVQGGITQKTMTPPTFTGTGFLPSQVDEKFTPYDKNKLAELVGSADYQTLSKYNTIQSLLTPKQKKYTHLIYDQPDGIYGFSQEDNRFEKIQEENPFYEEPLIEGSDFVDATKVKGLEKWKGYTVEEKVWRDKNGEIVKRSGQYNNPMKPAYKTGKNSKKIYDIDAYKEKLAKYTSRESDLFKKIEKYKSDTGGAPIGSYGNAINKAYDKEEISFFNEMIPDAKEWVNKNYYDNFKDGDEYSNRDAIYEEYTKGLTEDYENGDLDINLNNYEKPEGVSDKEWERELQAQVYRSALLWGKLKFRRL